MLAMISPVSPTETCSSDPTRSSTSARTTRKIWPMPASGGTGVLGQIIANRERMISDEP